MSLYNVKQYIFNDATGEMDFHNVASLTGLDVANKIKNKAMWNFVDHGWSIKYCDDKVLKAEKGHERIKLVIQEF